MTDVQDGEVRDGSTETPKGETLLGNWLMYHPVYKWVRALPWRARPPSSHLPLNASPRGCSQPPPGWVSPLNPIPPMTPKLEPVSQWMSHLLSIWGTRWGCLGAPWKLEKISLTLSLDPPLDS